MMIEDVSVSVREDNGQLKVNATFTIAGHGHIQNEEFPPGSGNIRKSEADRRRLQTIVKRALKIHFNGSSE